MLAGALVAFLLVHTSQARPHWYLKYKAYETGVMQPGMNGGMPHREMMVPSGNVAQPSNTIMSSNDGMVPMPMPMVPKEEEPYMTMDGNMVPNGDMSAPVSMPGMEVATAPEMVSMGNGNGGNGKDQRYAMLYLMPFSRGEMQEKGRPAVMMYMPRPADNGMGMGPVDSNMVMTDGAMGGPMNGGGQDEMEVPVGNHMGGMVDMTGENTVEMPSTMEGRDDMGMEETMAAAPVNGMDKNGQDMGGDSNNGQMSSQGSLSHPHYNYFLKHYRKYHTTPPPPTCTTYGQYLPDPEDKCKFIWCINTSEPKEKGQGLSIGPAHFRCPKGTSVPRGYSSDVKQSPCQDFDETC